ncbi:MAG: hypothetical protein D3913_10080, partial [Candidatus Electrothrix sp. LOE1_4_5]|nr:hypothetical protein [Candidatus Electrothrix gigas]
MTIKNQSDSLDFLHIIRLVFADLRFEWILSLCMILALGAVFAPLFILLGLQGGIIGNMLDDLQKDPVSRLVMPKWETSLDEAWLASLRKETGALIESPTAVLLLDVEGMNNPINVLPTNETDPLLMENSITLENWKKSLVLSTPLAADLRKKQGDPITLTLIRSTGQEERKLVNMKVAGVLPFKASQDSKIWLDAHLFKKLHQWRRGGAVPELGLAGGGTTLSPEYDGIVTLLKRIPSDAEYRTMIGRGLGFSQLPTLFDVTSWGYPAEQQARLWKPLNSRVFEHNFTSLVNRHNEMGFQAEPLPYIDDFKVTLRSDGKNIALRLSSFLAKEKTTPPSGSSNLRHVWISLDDKKQFPYPNAEMTFSTTASGEEIIVPVQIHPLEGIPQDYLVTDPQFAGKMNAARRQEAMYDVQAGEFRPVE